MLIECITCQKIFNATTAYYFERAGEFFFNHEETQLICMNTPIDSKKIRHMLRHKILGDNYYNYCFRENCCHIDK